mmetsp:Transcript_39580/g.117750  ORF Transcript_39580/g.117750 Transcript_39580/m.117750 type:complete len:337 (+) Transcript_39580:460-1470(+)
MRSRGPDMADSRPCTSSPSSALINGSTLKLPVTTPSPPPPSSSPASCPSTAAVPAAAADRLHSAASGAARTTCITTSSNASCSGSSGRSAAAMSASAATQSVTPSRFPHAGVALPQRARSKKRPSSLLLSLPWSSAAARHMDSHCVRLMNAYCCEPPAQQYATYASRKRSLASGGTHTGKLPGRQRVLASVADGLLGCASAAWLQRLDRRDASRVRVRPQLAATRLVRSSSRNSANLSMHHPASSVGSHLAVPYMVAIPAPSEAKARDRRRRRCSLSSCCYRCFVEVGHGPTAAASGGESRALGRPTSGSQCKQTATTTIRPRRAFAFVTAASTSR